MDLNSKIFVAGHSGMVGSSILRALKLRGFSNLVLKNSNELDLRDENKVKTFFSIEKPEYVFLAAALVGGIQANIDNQSKFLIDNIKIQNNVIQSAFDTKVKRLLFLSSSCVYPRNSIQPMKEDYLLSGNLEPTNEGYALAKITGMKLIEYLNKQYGTNFISVMPSNVYGPHDNFDPNRSHVLAASIVRVYNAIIQKKNSITIWGDGKARREFIFVEDLAEALIFIMESYSQNSHINIGVGYDVSIMELNQLISKVLGFKGEILTDDSKPNGMPQKLLELSKLHGLGWRHKTDLEEGIRKTFNWYKTNLK
jgi:GDP-L-fucose synthase